MSTDDPTEEPSYLSDEVLAEAGLNTPGDKAMVKYSHYRNIGLSQKEARAKLAPGELAAMDQALERIHNDPAEQIRSISGLMNTFQNGGSDAQ
ncbi:hypothetical protein [Amycolatopsis pithecellobii]|uniref:Uncharacterized protein n=1 Tax=Amycolatopsis pithecellobii TaxID=664692 RepID=A0A6N7Z5X1_9PSEU|nr:hypothetical protein [Amycolatopsis pithecellobii]MTD57159.1 hypothetical protein [Amycolatopsis pithecellobii]